LGAGVLAGTAFASESSEPSVIGIRLSLTAWALNGGGASRSKSGTGVLGSTQRNSLATLRRALVVSAAGQCLLEVCKKVAFDTYSSTQTTLIKCETSYSRN
jgi:hypothetical protein